MAGKKDYDATKNLPEDEPVQVLPKGTKTGLNITPEVKQVANGWHAGARALNITVRGGTAEEAERLSQEAVEKAVELRARPERLSALRSGRLSRRRTRAD